MSVDAKLILEAGESDRAHRIRLASLIENSDGPIRVASAYVTDRDFFFACRDRDRRLLTSLSPMDLASGSTSIKTLRALIESGVDIRIVNYSPRFHAKIYMFGASAAVVTSANLTKSAFESNIEVGVEIGAKQTDELVAWYDSLWESAADLAIDDLSKMHKQIEKIRKQYAQLKKLAKQKLVVKSFPAKKANSVAAFMDQAERFFLINTNRRYDSKNKTETGGFGLEEMMHSRGLATAWSSFNYSTHMESVKKGDVILAFAKGSGIIGVGIAKSSHEVLGADDDGRLRSKDEVHGDEWRVPTRWIAWTNDKNAIPFSDAPNTTFLNISSNKYAGLREAVRDHIWDRDFE